MLTFLCNFRILGSMNFGEKIRQLRKDKNLTLRELANKLDINFTYLSKIENMTEEDGKPTIPSRETIIKLAHELSADSEELLLLAQKIPSTIDSWTRIKSFQVFFRTARSHGISEEEWQELARLLRELKGNPKDNK